MPDLTQSTQFSTTTWACAGTLDYDSVAYTYVYSVLDCGDKVVAGLLNNTIVKKTTPGKP